MKLNEWTSVLKSTVRICGICVMLAKVASATEMHAELPARTQAIFQFATDLQATGDATRAALEIRSLAAEMDSPALRVPLLLLAAQIYQSQADWKRMQGLLEQAEAQDADSIHPVDYLLLKMALARGRRDWAEAALWAEELRTIPPTGTLLSRSYSTDWLAREQAFIALRNGHPQTAREALLRLSESDRTAALQALDVYTQGRDKSPTVGGLLGLIPGMGYAYSGEWGNCIRSMILNAIFGWAMVETGHEERWGLFAVSTFFELTWYSGSIYGGIDAAYRYNQQRLETACEAIQGTGTAPCIPFSMEILRISF